jgi:trimeric autotransporter adhesin
VHSESKIHESCWTTARVIGRASIVLCLLTGPALAASFVVTSSGDTPYPPAGNTPCSDAPASCTLRAAIVEGNKKAGPHTITFAVPKVTLTNGGGLALQAPFIITGLPTPRTIIDGGGLSCFSLTDATSALNPKGANGTIISNLSIQHCSGDAISANGHGFKILNNYIGTDVTGLAATATTAATGHGISVSSSRVYVAIDTTGKINTFLKDTYASFPFPLPDFSMPDVSGQINKFSTNLVTALVALTDPVIITGNVISANGGNGIEIFSENLAAVIVTGNFIGTDAAGAFALPNGKSGVHFTGSTFGNLVGPGNVISGNKDHGVLVESGSVLLPNFIMGNLIGLGSVAAAKVGNGKSGIYVSSAKPSTEAAGYNAASLALVMASNLIGGNKGANNNTSPDTLGADEGGIVVTGSSSGLKIVANTIGIGEFPAGTPVASSIYGNAGDGIIATTSVQIGGSSAGEGNIIAGNARHGVVVKVSSTAGVSILGNSIGVHPKLAGNLTLGNGSDGIHIDAASATTVGGAGATDLNVIAANKRHGIALRNGGTSNGWSNLFQRNAIYHNTLLGIDLDHPRNVADDPFHTPYPANYANLDQNQPTICPSAAPGCAGSTAPSSSGATTKLDWTLVAKPLSTYRLELFKVDAATVSSATSMTFLGEQTVSSDLKGELSGCSSGRCTSTFSGNAAGGYVVMTATDITAVVIGTGSPSWMSMLKCFVLKNCLTNNTSELSNVAQVGGTAATAPTVATTAASAVTETGATLNGTVNANGSETTVSFTYGLTTSYGSTATAAQSPLAASSASGTAVSAALTGLTCNSTYHYRAAATNAGGAASGDDLSFTTAACANGGGDSGGCSLSGALAPTGLALLLALVVLGAAVLRRRRR